MLPLREDRRTLRFLGLVFVVVAVLSWVSSQLRPAGFHVIVWAPQAGVAVLALLKLRTRPWLVLSVMALAITLGRGLAEHRWLVAPGWAGPLQ